MKKTTRCRFPRFDSRTSRLEGIALSGLGLAGAALIAGAVTNSLHFAQGHQRAVRAWSTAGAAQPQLARHAQELHLTNLTRGAGSPTLTHFDTLLETQASAASQLSVPQCQMMAEGAAQ